MARVVVMEGSSVVFEEDGYNTGDAQRRKQALERQYPQRDGYYVAVYA